MHKFLLLIILSMLCLPGFAQEDEALELTPAPSGRVIIRGESNLPDSQPEAPQKPVDTENPDVAELEAIRAAQQKKIEIVESAVAPIAKPLRNPLEEMKKLGYEQISAMALMDERVIGILQRTLKERPVASLSPEKVKELITERSAGSMFEKLFKKFPKLLDFSVNFLRDAKALPSLMGIFVRKSDLKTYGYVWLTIFIFGLFLKRRVIKPKWAFGKRFIYSIIFSFFLTSASLFIFYSMFSEELNPTLSLIFRT